MHCLSQQTLRRLLTLATLALLSATVALAQDTTPPANRNFATNGTDNWSYAAIVGASEKKLYVVTKSDPTHSHACLVRSLSVDQLTCVAPFNRTRIYKPEEITSLIMRVDDGFKIRFVSAALSVSGTAFWGTVFLTATCPACAAATAVTALFSLIAAVAVDIGDPQRETLLYLAHGQTLQVKLHHPPTR